MELELAPDGRSITIRAQHCPTVPAPRLAAALGAAVQAAVEAALTRLHTDRLHTDAAAPPETVETVPVGAVAVGTVPRPRTGEQDRDQDGVRRRALALLDRGLSDAAVCAQLGISHGRLLRWDDAAAYDAHVDELAEVGGRR